MNCLAKVTFVAMLMAIVYGEPPSEQQRDEALRDYENKRLHLCGPYITRAVGMVCHYKYRSQFEKKSSLDREGANLLFGNQFLEGPKNNVLEDVDDFFPASWPRLSRRESYTLKSRRQKRGIYEECCVNGCTLSELAGYCSSG